MTLSRRRGKVARTPKSTWKYRQPYLPPISCFVVTEAIVDNLLFVSIWFLRRKQSLSDKLHLLRFISCCVCFVVWREVFSEAIPGLRCAISFDFDEKCETHINSRVLALQGWFLKAVAAQQPPAMRDVMLFSRAAAVANVTLSTAAAPVCESVLPLLPLVLLLRLWQESPLPTVYWRGEKRLLPLFLWKKKQQK